MVSSNTHNHKFVVLEVYQWLGNKYEKEFVEMDLCRVLITRVCEIIDSILLSDEQRFIFLSNNSSNSSGGSSTSNTGTQTS
jgi:hypothetical protein